MTRWLLCSLVVLSLSSSVIAQTPVRTEAELLSETAQQPQSLAAYLELARLYAGQKRFDDAERMLNRALAVLQVQRAVAGMSQPQTVAASPAASGVVAPPGAPIRVGGGISPPIKIKNVEPTYPPTMLAARVSGVVYLEAVIGPDGTVTSLQVIRSPHPDFDAASLQAVRQWKYLPTLVNGVAVSVIMTVTVSFRVG